MQVDLRDATLHEPTERAIAFGYWPRVAVAGVDLIGEIENWLTPLPMRANERGLREVEVHLGPGVYAYKFRHDDGSYHLDPDNPRTVARDGHQNSVLVVDGTPEPILHAPAAPWAQRLGDGLVRVRAALRHGYGLGLALRHRDGLEARLTPMAKVGVEDEHTLYEVDVPGSSERFEYAFVLDDGRTIAQGGPHGRMFTLEGEHVETPPDWWRTGVMYTAFVDRFRRRGTPCIVPEGERERAGGDLWGVIDALDHLAALGVTILHLTPIALSPSAHRYDAVDPRVVDPALGGEEALRALLEAAHARGLRIVLDVAATHVHRDHFAFRDVRARGPASPYWSWFYAYRFPFDEGPDGGYLHYPKGQWHEPLLRTTSAEVVEHVVGHFEHFARLGVDGFRIDAACSLPVGLSRRIRRAVRAIRPDAVVWGEVTVDNTQRWLSAGALDAATDFVAQAAERAFLRGECSAEALCARLARRRFARVGPGTRSIAFTANHDQPRLRTLLGDRALARAAHVLLLARAELPALYYGDEISLFTSSGERSWEDAWPDRAVMPWSEADWDHDTLTLVRALIALRRSSRALWEGEEEWLPARDPDGATLDDVLVLRRSRGDEVFDVLLSRAHTPREVALPPGPRASHVVLASGEAVLRGQTLTLAPRSAAIVRRALEPDVRAFWSDALARAAALAAESFAAGSPEVPALPTRLYITVTERCNLRCAHCITQAPRLTAEGRARTLAPWLREALREPLTAASYLGFVHGGESLVTPELFALLAFAQTARSQVHGMLDVHLLSNGMLLGGERAEALLDHGVTSLAVSLDGASPQTNDRLRLGGRFDTIVRNVARLVALRSQRGHDLRIGLSTVVTRANLGELPRLGELARELGVDWLKLEETYGVNELSRSLAVPADSGMLRDQVAALRERLAGSPVVLVDHLGDTSGCACSPSARARAFREADDFANRARMRPCRMLWEQAAIDPDGVVRPIDFGHGALGSLRERPFVELWNAPVLQAARRRQAAALGDAGRRACLAS